MKGNQNKLQLVLSILGLIGIPVIFLNFLGSYSIWDSSFDRYAWFYALPGLFTVLIYLATFRWLITGKFTLVEKVLAYLSSLMMVFCLVYLFAFEMHYPMEIGDWIFILIPCLIYVFGIFSFIKLKGKEYKYVLILQIPPLAHYFFCSFSFYPFIEIGAIIGFVPAAAYLLQIVTQLQLGKNS